MKSGRPRFHPAREINRVPPQIVDVLALPNDAGHDRTCIDAHPELQRSVVFHGVLAGNVDHADGHAHHALGVIGHRHRQAAHRHVGVPHRLDLLDTKIARGDVSRQGSSGKLRPASPTGTRAAAILRPSPKH